MAFLSTLQTRFGRTIDESVEFAKQNPLQTHKPFFSNEKEFLLLRGHSEALSDLFNVRDKVHVTCSAQLDWSFRAHSDQKQAGTCNHRKACMCFLKQQNGRSDSRR